jgi:hypothetical protein
MIKTRTSEGKRASARLGNYIGNGTPFGYKKDSIEKRRDRTLLLVEEDAQWAKYMFEEFVRGKSLEQIAKVLNDRRVSKSAGNLKKDTTTKWYGSTIKKILQNTVYIGKAMQSFKNHDTGETEDIPITTPRIVSDLTFEIAQSRLETLSQDAKRGGGEQEYLLSRKIIDTETGRKFVGLLRNKDKKASYRRKAFELNGKKYKNMEIP